MSTPNAQFELEELRDARAKAEKEADTAKRSRTIGLAPGYTNLQLSPTLEGLK